MTAFASGFLTYLALVVAIGAQTLFLLRQSVRGDRAWTAIGICFLGDVVLLSAGTAGIGVVAQRWPWLVTALTVAGVVYLLWFALSALLSSVRGHRTLEEAAAEVRDDAWAPSAEEVAVMTGRLPVVPPAGEGRGEPGPGAVAAPETAPAAASGAAAAVVPVAVRTRPAPAPTRPRMAAPRTPLRRLVLLSLSVSLLNPHAILDAVVMMGTFAQAFGAQKWAYAGGAIAAGALWFGLLGWGGAKLAPVMNTPRTWRVVDAVVAVLMLAIAVKVGLTLL